MIKHAFYLTVLALLFCLAACISSIKPEALYGKWKYTKVEHPNADPPTSLRPEDLQAQSPSIEFLSNNKFVIMWGGKALSQGTFSTVGQNIMIKEDLPGGQSRKFSFLVSKLTDKDIVFETKGDDASRVTAVKL